MKHVMRTFLLLPALLLLAWSGCGSSAGGQVSSNNPPIAYVNKPGIILIQLFNVPGFIYPPINAVPTWTLYGDGTLLIHSSAGNQLQQTQLSTGEIQQLLDKIYATPKPIIENVRKIMLLKQ